MKASGTKILFLILCLFFILACQEHSSHLSEKDIVIRDLPGIKEKAFSLNMSISTFAHPAGSIPQRKAKKMIEDELKQHDILVQVQSFRDETPTRFNRKYLRKKRIFGIDESKQTDEISQNRRFFNVVGYVPGKSKNTIVLGSHYDTKYLYHGECLGANDGGSSSAFLLSLIPHLKKALQEEKLNYSYLLVFFDGEEAFLQDWSDGENLHPFGQQDHLYGSRYFVNNLKNKQYKVNEQDSLNIAGLILFDMIGSKNLTLIRELNSSDFLYDILADYGKLLASHYLIEDSPFQPHDSIRITDDHLPFLEAGIPAIDVIDFTNREHWHTANDVMTHIERKNFETMGLILLNALPQIEKTLRKGQP